MTLFVDTSVWSLAFRRTPMKPEDGRVSRLRRALSEGEVVVATGLVLQELLQGFSGPYAQPGLNGAKSLRSRRCRSTPSRCLETRLAGVGVVGGWEQSVGLGEMRDQCVESGAREAGDREHVWGVRAGETGGGGLVVALKSRVCDLVLENERRLGFHPGDRWPVAVVERVVLAGWVEGRLELLRWRG